MSPRITYQPVPRKTYQILQTNQLLRAPLLHLLSNYIMTTMQHQSHDKFQAGDVVYTLYGAGVIVSTTDPSNSGESSDDGRPEQQERPMSNPERWYTVRLWRPPNHSVGCSAVAKLRSPVILKLLPAAPGMLTYLQTLEGDRTDADKILVMVHCYYQHRDTFLVSYDLPDDFDLTRTLSATQSSDATKPLSYVEVSSNQLSTAAPSAKFYPILESLMIRADRTAATAQEILQSETSKRIVETAGKAIQDGVEKLTAIGVDKGYTTDITPSIHGMELTAKNELPKIEENVRQVMTMIKDKEITTLFQECKNRLEQLSANNLSDVTRQTLEKSGIYVHIRDDVNVETSNLMRSIKTSRESALAALRDFMKYAEIDDLTDVQTEISKKFANAFDSLSNAAKSDRGLDSIFASIAEKTTVWQEATGRLMSTRSAGLFMEGASRIQARAIAIFGNGQMQALGEIGSKLAKSFSEGDAALARLKSIELGDAVKNRLVKAIEVRSESLGGLDGIIVGALSTIKIRGDAENRIPHLLQSLQQNASSVTSNAHETLISVLSSRSLYRDRVLLRLEKTLCDLDEQIGDDLSPADIAAIVRGEGGTAKIFEPIARRAMKQIDKQLDAAESQVTDETTLSVLNRIRKITSGELTLTALMDDIVNVLNDDAVVAAGESLVLQSEQVFDVLEGVSANKAVSEAIQIVEKAGITKETVMREFEKLKVDDLLGVAEKAVTDAKTRRKLLSTATDVALDFLLRILPSMPVPPFEGVKDGLVYHISNLSMKGFKVKKEDIQIELAGMRATRHQNGQQLKHVSFGDSVPPTYSSIQKTDSTDSEGGELDIDDVLRPIKATELLIIDIRNTSAVLENAMWSFEQTYLPYLKGGGVANVKMSGGSIRLQFELRKRRKYITKGSQTENVEWEPVLCLHDRSCAISEVDLTLEGDSTVTWLMNKVASVFKSTLRDYVVATIVKVLTNRSGWILTKLNKILSPYWDLILRTAKLDLINLVEADDDVIVSESVYSEHAFVELVWRERLPLGMNLLMNDDSGLLKVVDFPRGSQARVVCEKRGFDSDAFKGATIVAVNGTQYEDQDELFASLKHPGRPKTIRFRLADTDDAERLRKFLEMYKPTAVTSDQREFIFRKVHFLEEGELGIEFNTSVDYAGLAVSRFVEGAGGIVLAAERSGEVSLGDLLTHINDEMILQCEGGGLAYAMKLLESTAGIRPLSLTFTEPYMRTVEVQKVEEAPGLDCGGGPSELVFGESIEGGKRRVLIEGFTNVSGMAERCGVLIGDQLVFINGLPVGVGCRWLDAPSSPSLQDVMDMLNNTSFYPIGLTFARRQQQKVSRWAVSTDEFSDSEAETICVTASSHDRLGMLLGQMDNGDITVSDFQGVPGIFQQAMEIYKQKNGGFCFAVESINGQIVPSYSSPEIVRNALNRSWMATDTTLLILCDDEQKKWLYSNF